MKFKMIYLYVGLIIMLILFLTIEENNFFDKTNTKKVLDNSNTVVNTKSMNPDKKTPTKENVNKDVYHKIEKFKEAIVKNPSDTLMIRKYAELLALSHKSNDAIKTYDMILEIDPKRTDVLFEKSFIYFSKLNYIDALEATKDILKIEHNNSKAYYNLGAIYASIGNKKEAKKNWNFIVNNYPDAQEAKLAKESLKKLN